MKDISSKVKFLIMGAICVFVLSLIFMLASENSRKLTVYAANEAVTPQSDFTIEYDYKYDNDVYSWEYDGKEAYDSLIEHIDVRGLDFGRDNVKYKYAAITDGVVGEYSSDSPVKAGKYKTFAYYENNNATLTSNELAFEILPRKIYARISECGGIFGGEIKAAEISIIAYNQNTLDSLSILKQIDYQVLYYGTSYDETWSYSRTNPTAIAPIKAGKFNLLIRLSPDPVNENFVLVDDNGKSVENIESDFIIGKSLINSKSLTVAPLTYNRNIQYASQALKGDRGMGVLYNVVGKETATNAGTYSVSLKLLDEKNYAWQDGEGATVQIEWTIMRCVLAKPRQDGLIVEKDNLYSFTPAGFDETRMNIFGESAKENGKYKVIVSLKDKDNYVWSDGTDGDFEIEWTLELDVSLEFIALTVVLSIFLAIALGVFVYIVFLKNKFRREERQAEGVI